MPKKRNETPLSPEQRAMLSSAVGQRTILEVKRFIMALHATDFRVDASELESIIHEKLVLAVRDFDPARPGALQSFRSFAGRYVHKRVVEELRSSRYRRDPVEVPVSAIGRELEDLASVNYPTPVEVRPSDIGDEDRLDEIQREGEAQFRTFNKKQYQRHLAVTALVAAVPATPDEQVAGQQYIVWLRHEVKEAMALLSEARDREVLHERFWLELAYEAIGKRRRPPVQKSTARRMVTIAATELGYLLRIRGSSGPARAGLT